MLMNGLTEKGISIIMVSSEMEELIGMADRILVLREGRHHRRTDFEGAIHAGKDHGNSRR